MEFPVPSVSIFTIPTGATSGQRIVIDGTTGLILVYNASNQLVDKIGGPLGAIISYAVGPTGSVGIQQGRILFGSPDNFTGAASVNSGNIDGGTLTLSSGVGNITPFGDGVTVFETGGTSSSQPGNPANPKVEITDTNNTGVADLTVSGAVFKTTIAGVPETWHTPAYNAGWAGGPSGGTVQPFEYRLDIQDNVAFQGVFHTTNNTPNAVVFTLPVGWRPVIEQRFGAVLNNGGTLSLLLVQVLPTGDVQIFPNPAVANADVNISGFIPLGNLP